MGFMDDIHAFNEKVKTDNQAVFVGTVAEVQNSIQFGSPLTGSLGQPVDKGELLVSWQSEFQDEHHATVSTNSDHAESNEDGIARPGGGPYIQRSPVGGRWSVAHTRAGLQRIVDAEARKLAP